MAPSGATSISIKYIILTAALIGTFQAATWFSLSLVSILFYESAIEIDTTSQHEYGNYIYNYYLNRNNPNGENYIIYPETFNYFMWIYLVLSFIWLVSSCFILWAVVRGKWKNMSKLIIFWSSITIAIAVTDIILMSLVAADLQKAHDLSNNPTETTTETTTKTTTETTTETTIVTSTTVSTTVDPSLTSTIPGTSTHVTSTSTPGSPSTGSSNPTSSTNPTIYTSTSGTTTITETPDSTVSTKPTVSTSTPNSHSSSSSNLTSSMSPTTPKSTSTNITPTDETSESIVSTKPTVSTSTPNSHSTSSSNPTSSTNPAIPTTTITETSDSTVFTKPTVSTTTPKTPSTSSSHQTSFTNPTVPTSTSITTSISPTDSITSTTTKKYTTAHKTTIPTSQSTSFITHIPTKPVKTTSSPDPTIEVPQGRYLQLSENLSTVVFPQSTYTSMGIVMTIAARGYVLWCINVILAIVLIVLVRQMKKMNRPTLLPPIDAFDTRTRPFTLYDQTDIGTGHDNNGFTVDDNIIFSPKRTVVPTVENISRNPLSNSNRSSINDSQPYIFSTPRPIEIARPFRNDPTPMTKLAKIGKSGRGRRTPPQSVPSPVPPSNVPYIPDPDYTPPISPEPQTKSVLKPRSKYIF